VGRAERRARQARARTGPARRASRAHPPHPQCELSDSDGVARFVRRPLHVCSAGRRCDRLREVPSPHQLHGARHAASRAKKRSHGPRRPLRHGRVPSHRVRRGARVHARGPRPRARFSRRDCRRARTRVAGMTFDLVLVGFGNVARRFVGLLEEKRTALADEFGLDVRIAGVTTMRHGRAYAARGLESRTLLEAAERGEMIGRDEMALSTADFIRHAARKGSAATDGRLVVIETTTLDVRRGEPAIEHVRTALASGAHVVTANKGPVAFAYAALADEARSAGRRFLFEGAVMDGIPIFNLARETLPAVQIVGFRGVVNTTTNFILTAMEGGETFDAALEAMRAAGIAEADASLDTDGWDAAAKTAALANVLLGARLTPHDVEREGIT